MNKNNFEYTVVLTSCGRFDLLRQTVKTFLQFVDIAPKEFIITEDSGDEKVKDALIGLDAPFKFIINNPRLGQAKSADKAYSMVKTEYIFHCEDDWEFFRSGFIAESLILLKQFPKVSVVMLRGRDEHRKLRQLQAETLEKVRFVRAYPKLHRKFFSYGYGVGLRRLSDYKLLVSFAAVGGEDRISCAFKSLGFATAHLEIPAICHIGWGEHIPDIGQKESKFFIKRKIKRYQQKFILLKWQLFGVPKKLLR